MKIEELMNWKYCYSAPGVAKSASIIEIEKLQTIVDDLETRINELTKDQ